MTDKPQKMAAITAQCPNSACARPLRVAPQFAGQQVACIHCGSTIQVPPLAREGPIMMVRAICNLDGQPFSILFRKLGTEGWIAEKPFKRSEHGAQQRYEAKALKGVHVAETYPGCPHCGNKGGFYCDHCDLLNCLGAAVTTKDGQIAACCAQCGRGGILSGRLEEVKGSREQ